MYVYKIICGSYDGADHTYLYHPERFSQKTFEKMTEQVFRLRVKEVITKETETYRNDPKYKHKDLHITISEIFRKYWDSCPNLGGDEFVEHFISLFGFARFEFAGTVSFDSLDCTLTLPPKDKTNYTADIQEEVEFVDDGIHDKIKKSLMKEYQNFEWDNV